MAKLRSRSACARVQKSNYRNTKRKTVSQKVRESESLLVFLIAIFLSIASVSYLLQTNSLATRGYEVEDYQDQLELLTEENQNLKNREAELRSIKNLEGEKSRLTALGAGDIGYVSAGGDAVALNK